MNTKVITIAILLVLAALIAALFGSDMLNRGESTPGADLGDAGSCQELCQESCADFQGGEKDQCLSECAELCEGNF